MFRSNTCGSLALIVALATPALAQQGEHDQYQPSRGDRPEPGPLPRRLQVLHDAADVPLAVEHVVVVLVPRPTVLGDAPSGAWVRSGQRRC